MYKYDGKCPECHGNQAQVMGDYINCGCGLVGDMTKMKFCERVPVFSPVKPENSTLAKGQLYEDDSGNIWMYEGNVQGCGRLVNGTFCSVCRSFLPKKVDRPSYSGKPSTRIRSAP